MNTPQTWSDSPIHNELAAWELLKEARRERDEARETLAELRASVLDLSHPNIKMILSERDEAREVLREIRDGEVNPEDEADRFLRDHVPSKLTTVTEQRDRLAEAVNAATILIAARGRHNTMLAYEGLRDTLQSLKQSTEP